jgi:hypothetical protein
MPNQKKTASPSYNVFDSWYRQCRSGNPWIRVWLKSFLIGWGVPLTLLGIAGIPTGLLTLTIGQVGIYTAFSGNMSLTNKFAVVAFILFKPLVVFFYNGYISVLVSNAVKTLTLGMAGGCLIFFPLLQREEWIVRLRLILYIVGYFAILSMLPFFPIIFAIGFPLVLMVALRRWRPKLTIFVNFLLFIPSLISLLGLQMMVEDFNPMIWINPFAPMAGMTPREYFKKQDFKKRALLGADTGDVYTIQMVLREFKLSPQQRLKYITMLRRYPNQRTPQIEHEYQELADKLGRLPKNTARMPPAFRVLLAEDPILNSPGISEQRSRLRRKELMDRWMELHPEQAIPGFN